MIAIGVMLAVLVLVAGLVIPLVLRRWTLSEVKTEARLHSPETHTVTHAVSDGVDPVVELAALRSAGFTSLVDFEGGSERVVVECDEADREHVRDIIEHASSSSSSEPERRAGHVSFLDEADTA